MSDSKFNCSGVLFLSKVTPVIEAIFGHLDIAACLDANGNIRFSGGAYSPDWDDIRERLVAEVLIPVMADADVQVDEDCMDSVLYVLADQFEQAHNDELMSFIADTPFDLGEDVDIGSLYFLAKCFDDGHGLRSMHYESAWISSSSVSGFFGASTLFESEKLSIQNRSKDDLSWTVEFDKLLQHQDLHIAANRLSSRIGSIIDGIRDDDERNAVIVATALQLLVKARKPVIVPLDTLLSLWSSFLAVSIWNDRLQDAFLFFPEETHIEDVWLWFERMNPQFSVEKILFK